jgi:hypothetical protein
MSLKALNQYEQNTAGTYREMFDLPLLPVNERFVKNPYINGKAGCSDVVCFSLTGGMLPCKPAGNTMLYYDASGKISKVPVRII